MTSEPTDAEGLAGEEVVVEPLVSDVPANAEWIERARRRPTRPSVVGTEDLMAEVDEEFGA